MGNLRTLTILALLIIALIKIEAKTDSLGLRQLPEFPFVFVSNDDDSTRLVISDSLFDAASRGIRFQVNKTDLLPTDPFIPLYREQLVPWLTTNDMQLKQVFVRGAASPEGPYDNNVRLSRERTRRLVQFLSSALRQPVNDDILESQSITEDYALLVKMMAQKSDRDYKRVNEVWLSCNGDEKCCKEKLMSLDKGRLWARLKKEYFPALRQARVILWFVRRKPQIEIPKYDFSQPIPSADVIPFALADMNQPVEYTRRHLIAVRTNLIHDLLIMPKFGWAPGINLQLEYYPLNGHLTYNLGFTFTNHRHWTSYKFFQIRDVRAEVRRYFRGGGVFKGAYLGAYGEFMKYGIGFSKSQGWQGEGGGAGLSIGYTWPLNRKGNLRLEVSASLGVFITRYDPYVYGNPITGDESSDWYYYDYHGNTSEFQKRNRQFFWFGPTDAGIHITYDIIYRKKKPVGYYEQKGGKR